MVTSRKRDPIPEYKTRLPDSRIAAQTYPDYPYKYASGCHWLWCWAWKIDDLFSRVDYRPHEWDGFILWPCSECKTAIQEYTEGFPVQMARIQTSLTEADRDFSRWKKSPTPNNLAKYNRSAIQLSKTIFEVIVPMGKELDLEITRDAHQPPKTNVEPKEKSWADDLTPQQKKLLSLFCKNRKKMLYSFDDIRAVWEKDVSEDGIYQALKRLRKVLPKDQWDLEIRRSSYEVEFHRKGQMKE